MLGLFRPPQKSILLADERHGAWLFFLLIMTDSNSRSFCAVGRRGTRSVPLRLSACSLSTPFSRERMDRPSSRQRCDAMLRTSFLRIEVQRSCVAHRRQFRTIYPLPCVWPCRSAGTVACCNKTVHLQTLDCRTFFDERRQCG